MKGKAVIDRDRCKGCSYCVLFCPEGVLAIDREFNRSGYFPAAVRRPERCTGCSICAEMCPDVAITVWREKRS